ncbi:hypothetical protein P0W64_22405 [Tsukamurella sp. 8F]|uniref:hypothetical protein n=1 Tax=unclassified Tsukamurella TaxID=2633480 RepID=UPI0023B982E1|nr:MULTISPECIES: hypothetical protein [unclassified Tsukamurella]MDF0531744.1 hypothetical protein [Tsukamurella sp. 8J]MDF0589542.1 hypothetical protein [Tsukamurella sp. 8F]
MAETQSTGFGTEQVYRMRPPRQLEQQFSQLGAQGEIEWRGERWSVFGDVVRYNGSPNTRHIELTVRRR